MKWLRFFLISVLLHLSFAGFSQGISISGKDIPLQKVFESIKSQTGLFFFYDASLLRDIKPITVKWKNIPLSTALNEIFKDQPLTWQLEDRTITIVKKTESPVSKTQIPSHPLLSFNVKGIIRDSEGNPISDVSVLIKGTKQGTVSGSNGRFMINAVKNNVLIFSSVNYRSTEAKAENGEMDIRLQLDVKPMELFMVGGNLNAIRRKSDATAVTVLDSKTLEKIPGNTLDEVFRGWVPGVNNFDVGDYPEEFPSLSIRGANNPASLGIIAVYVDGIEYAGGSGYLSQLDKNNIDRIEIIRGPGAATMYGTGSNGGIVQIFTKKGKADINSIHLTTSAGFIKSKWVDGNPFQQLHSLETSTHMKYGTIKMGGSFRANDAYLPDGGEKNKGFNGSAQLSRGKFQLHIAGRYIRRDFNISRRPYYDTAINPRKDIIIPGTTTPAYEWFNVKPTLSRNKKGETETTIYGANLSHNTTKKWVNNLDAGYTMNYNNETPLQNGTVPLQRQYYYSEAQITTLRYSNKLTAIENSNDFSAVITSGAEYKKYSNFSSITRATAASTIVFRKSENENYSAFVQMNPSYKNIYLTVGLRYESNDLFKPVLNPRLGLTTNFDTKSLTIKPKISWGKGIVSPTYEQRFGTYDPNGQTVYGNPNLKPQSQQGFDIGIEVYDKKGRGKFEIVHYDNNLQDMIAEGNGPMYVNVIKVANIGWEFSGDYQIKNFRIQGTLSIMNSNITDTTGSYILPQLQLPPGSRLINLPTHTAGINFTYQFFKLFRKADKGSISLNVTEVGGIKSLDYRGYALDVSYGRAPYSPEVIGYPVENSSVFRAGLFIDYFINNDLKFFVQGANILNSYEYEFSNEYPTHGAQWLFGLKYNFSEKNK